MNYQINHPLGESPLWRIASRCAAVVGILLSPNLVSAQSTNISANEADENIVLLSPFEVSADVEGDYSVSETLAGSRLRSNVKDVGAAMTIMTKTFMDDLGATDLMEVANFVPNVEALTTQESGQDDNTGTFRPQRFRIRGIFTEAQARNYFTDTIGQMVPGDSYNLERVTFSSGANSILFGAANPAGIINQTTARAVLDRKFSEIGFQTDNYGSVRFELKHNQPLVEDRLAIRFAYLNQDKEGWREPEWKQDERIYVAAKFKITDKTTFQANFESWDSARNVPYWGPSRNLFGRWTDAGMPLVPYTGVNPNPIEGVRTYAGANLTAILYGSAGQTDLAPSWLHHPVSDFNRESVTNHNRQTVPFDFAGDDNLAGNLRVDERWGTNWDASIEHQFTKDLNMQLAFYESTQRQDLWISWSANQIWADAASTLIDGSPNPDAGRYYVNAGVMQLRDFEFNNQTFRWTTSYKLDLLEVNKYLGRHQFALMYEDREGSRGTDRGQLFNTDPNRVNPNYLAGANKPRPVFYVNRDGQSTGPIPDTRNMAEYISQFPNITGEWANFTTGTWDENYQTSYLAAVQSNFFNDRLITTFGYRVDEQDFYNIAGSRWLREDRGFYLSYRDMGSVDAERVDDVSGISEDTYSAGAVYHLIESRGSLDYLSLAYNQSTNFEPSSGAPNYQGGIRGPSQGETQDFGIKFGLFGNKLEGNLNYFESGQVGARLTGIGYVTNGFNAIYEGLEEVTGDPAWLSRVLDNQTQNGDIFDNDAKGIALQFAYSPSRNWRIAFAASRDETVKSNIAPSSTLYIAENAPGLRSSVGATVLPDGRTVNEVLTDIDLQHARTLGQAGTQPLNQRQYKLSLNTNYSFREGRLRGWDIGGNLLWQDEPIIGWARDANGDIIPSERFYGDSMLNVGLALGYRTKIMNDKVTWITRLNVRNLFDDTDLQPAQAEESAAGSRVPLIYAYNFREPRSFILSTRFQF